MGVFFGLLGILERFSQDAKWHEVWVSEIF